MFADWKRKGNVSYTVSCSCVYVCARVRVYACVCTWICVMCVCMSGGWVCLTIPVTPVSAPINTHRKNYIAPLYIEWRISCHTPPPIPTAGTQLTHRTSSCACHPTLSPRAFHLAKRSMLEQALRELRIRATQGRGKRDYGYSYCKEDAMYEPSCVWTIFPVSISNMCTVPSIPPTPIRWQSGL